MRMKTMFAIAAIATALPAAALAPAASWNRVGGSDSVVSYIDANSIRTTGGTREALAMSVFAKPIGDRVWSATILYSFDCAQGHYRSLRYQHFGANGELLSDHASSTSSEKRYPEKGAINEKMFNFVCTGQGGTPITDPRDDADQVFAASH
jgi:hypothetical protein